MILQPAIFTLLLNASLAVLLLAAALPFALEVIRRWDPDSGADLQLRLERRTYLFSTLVALVLALQLAGVLLFIFNADRMAVLFVGAMCAVGSLNANPFGFPALLAQLLLFFLAAVWLIVNHVDAQARDYPLVKIKYGLMIGLLPVAATALVLQWRYFSGLSAEVITSCCGSVFADTGPGLASDLAALPPGPSLVAFCACLALAIGAALACGWRRRGGYRVAVASLLAFAAGLAGILAFLSLYIYEHPHHHCPFCLLKADYHYLGYALYVPLFLATAAGLGAGALQPFRRVPSLVAILPRVVARCCWVAATGFFAVLLIALVLIGRSRLILF